MSVNGLSKNNKRLHVFDIQSGFVNVEDGDIFGAQIYQIDASGTRTKSGVTDPSGRASVRVKPTTVEIVAEGGIDRDLDNQKSEFRLKMRVTPGAPFGNRYITPLTTLLADVSENEMDDVLRKLDLSNIDNNELTLKNPKDPSNIDIKQKQSKMATIIKFFKYSYLANYGIDYGDAHIDNDPCGNVVMPVAAESIIDLSSGIRLFDASGRINDLFTIKTREKMINKIKSIPGLQQIAAQKIDGGWPEPEAKTTLDGEFKIALDSINSNFEKRNSSLTFDAVNTNQKETDGMANTIPSIRRKRLN